MSEAPPLVPVREAFGTVYIVLDDFEHLGRVYRTDEATDADTVVRDLIQGQYNQPVRVVAFNINEGWSRDVSADIARAVAEAARAEDRPLGQATMEFVERHLSTAFLLPLA